MKKIFFTILALALIAGAGVAFYFYQLIYAPNVQAPPAGSTFHTLYIPTGAGVDKVLDSLTANHIIKNESSFMWVAQKMNYPNKVYAGKYLIAPNLNNRELVTQLRTGKQTPVELTINQVRKLDKLIHIADSLLELNSQELSNSLQNHPAIQELGFNEATLPALFLADTYQFNWNTSADEFISRMAKEYRRFWTPDKIAKASAIGLSPHEVITLAAIVEEEVIYPIEMPTVAGVYINRLKKGMPLQADPTVKYAVNDFSLRRILNKHLVVDSPYNTYLYAGLPPGPIRIPSKRAIESVLNYENHKYIYFVAKADFSGYHDFSTNYKQHLILARKYRNALNRRKIK